MKRMLIAAALLAIASLASADVDPPHYQATRVSDRSLRVAIIRPSRWDALNQANLGIIRRDYVNNIGTLKEAMRDRGLEVHEYDTGFFEQTYSGSTNMARDLWENLGAQYALAIVTYPNTSTASFSRYIRADSTNAQIIVIGDAGGAVTWAAGDTSISGFVDTKPGGYEALSANNRSFCLTAKADTMWALRIASGRRRTVLQSGMESVVRYMNPGTLTATTFIQDADSVNSNMPGVVSGVAGDSIAAANDYLGPMWKVNYTNSLADVIVGQGAIDGSLLYSNTLPAAQCPKSVSFVKFAQGGIPGRAYPQLLWSLICRFTKANPLPYAYDIDDAVDKYVDNTGAPERWTNTIASAFVRDTSAFYGLVPSAQLNPEHAVSYMRGQNPRYESAWSGPAHGYLRGMPWIHHAHDSTSGNKSSNLVGGFGGYASGNGANSTQGGVAVQKYSQRYASRDSTPMDATNMRDAAGNYFGPGNRWGIVQRLQYSDSLRRMVCPECQVPNYLTFPGNEVLTVGYRRRATTTNPLWYNHFSAHAVCPPESLFWAFHVGLGLASGQYLYLRVAVDNPRGGVAGDIGTYWQWDRDSVVACSPFLYPHERYSVRGPNGEVVQVVSVGSFLNGSSAWSAYTNNAASRTAKLLGLKNTLRKSEQADMEIGETFAGNGTDLNGMYSLLDTGHDHTYAQSARVLYNHPLNSSPAGYEFECSLRSVFEQMRVLDDIAGRRATRCVRGWEVFDK